MRDRRQHSGRGREMGAGAVPAKGRRDAWVMGISASHNGAYCLLRGSEIQVAIQEERLVGRKRARVYGGRRGLGFRYCLDAAGISAAELAMVVVSCQWSAAAQENDVWMNP